jgi:glycine/D-amino acid oxidase-like deaminating enzyme
MDLTSGNIYWLDINGPPEPAPRLTHDLTCDVAILGSGVTGALVADRLARDGLSVVLLDRRPRLASGSTPASTGLLQYEIDTPLTELAKKIGLVDARRAYRRSHRSLGDFRKLVTGLDDDAGLVARRSLYVAKSPDDIGFIEAEAEARSEIGIDVAVLDAAALQRDYGITRPGALRSADALEADTCRLTRALLRRAQRHGTRLFADSTVVRYDARRADTLGLTIDGPSQPRVTATHVVFATGYETPQFLDQRLCELRSTYAIASQPLADFGPWRERCLVWEHDDPYLYARTTPDGRVIVGGEDEKYADPAQRDAKIDAKAKTLVAKFAAMLPSLPALQPVYRWTGTFAQTPDGLPYIGSTDEFPGGHFALGYGGNGITFSLIAAQVIASTIAGQTDPDADLFRFGRKKN